MPVLECDAPVHISGVVVCQFLDIVLTLQMDRFPVLFLTYLPFQVIKYDAVHMVEDGNVLQLLCIQDEQATVDVFDPAVDA